MAVERPCPASRTHKPHWWSRTTRKTVTEETAGDTFSCPGSAATTLRDARQEMTERIRQSIEEGRGRSMFDTDDPTDLDRFHGAMCRCGVPRKPAGISRHVADDGLCTVHPDRPAQPWVLGADPGR
jgi:hypothetical protein